MMEQTGSVITYLEGVTEAVKVNYNVKSDNTGVTGIDGSIVKTVDNADTFAGNFNTRQDGQVFLCLGGILTVEERKAVSESIYEAIETFNSEVEQNED